MGDEKSLSHTKWNCKYDIVFAPKYRRKVFYGEKRRVVGEILRKLCEWKGVTILEANACPDHIHMLVEIPPKMSVSSFMGYLKGKSRLMLYNEPIHIYRLAFYYDPFSRKSSGFDFKTAAWVTVFCSRHNYHVAKATVDLFPLGAKALYTTILNEPLMPSR